MRRRPCFLVVDQEHPWSVSSRKLVLEAAKFNVITAYDTEEAAETARRFPNLDGAVLNADMVSGPECEELIAHLREAAPKLPIIITTTGAHPRCDHNEIYIDSLEPKQLLDCLQGLKKEATAEIEKSNVSPDSPPSGTR